MIEKKNELMFIAGTLVVGLFVMGMVLYRKYNKPSSESVYNTVVKQSQSTEVNDIEKDLELTELQDIDKELQQIEEELEKAY